MNKFTQKEPLELLNKYIDDGLSMFPPMKGYGMKFIEFSIEHPDMYRAIFMEDELSDFEYKMQAPRLIEVVKVAFDLNDKDAKWLVSNSIVYLHGMGALFATTHVAKTYENISYLLGTTFRGLLMQVKAPEDERVNMMPSGDPKALGAYEEYIKGKKNIIIGYGPEKEIYQIRIDAILYFEAVGENIFAYTKGNVYEIKQRLYKIEEHVTDFGFIRVAKSLLVNRNKITVVSHESGGRGLITMTNGESLVVSRSYLKSLMETIKDAAN